jgi:hypothetical protein
MKSLLHSLPAILPAALTIVVGCRVEYHAGLLCRDAEHPDLPATLPDCCEPSGERCVPDGEPPFDREVVLLRVDEDARAIVPLVPGVPPAPPDTCETYGLKPNFDGYTGLDGPNDCATCECTPAACALPKAVVAYSTASTCQDQAVATQVNAPADWDGSCFAAVPAPPDPLVEVAFEPPTVGCELLPPPTPQKPGAPNPILAKRALACAPDSVACQGQPKTTCFPSPYTLPPGFRRCLKKQGPAADTECTAAYPERLIAQLREYGVDDSRLCTPCKCEAVGADCVANVTVYQDDACGATVKTVTLTPDSVECQGIPPGNSIRGVSAQWSTNDPGICQASGGEPQGTVQFQQEILFCCEAQ